MVTVGILGATTVILTLNSYVGDPIEVIFTILCITISIIINILIVITLRIMGLLMLLFYSVRVARVRKIKRMEIHFAGYTDQRPKSTTPAVNISHIWKSVLRINSGNCDHNRVFPNNDKDEDYLGEGWSLRSHQFYQWINMTLIMQVFAIITNINLICSWSRFWSLGLK